MVMTAYTEFRFLRLERVDNLLPWAKQLIDDLRRALFQYGTIINSMSSGMGSVTSVAGGVGITNTPEPIIGVGTVDLDINSLAATAVSAAGDFYPMFPSGGAVPADQRKITRANLLGPELSGITSLSTTGIVVRTGLGTYTTRSLVAPAAGFTIGNNDGVAGNPTFTLADDLAALEGLGTTGIAVRTAASTWTTRTLVPPAAGITITDPAGLAGNPTLVLADDLAAVEGLGTFGLVTRTALNTWTTRTLQPPAAGITITNPAGLAGDPTLVLANDLAALEAMSGFGLVTRTAAETYAQRTITAGAGISVTNGDGVAGNPVIASTATVITAGSTTTAAVNHVRSFTITITDASVTVNSKIFAQLTNELDKVTFHVVPGAGTFDLTTEVDEFESNGYLNGTYNIAYLISA